jgi:hypothetical protein
MLCGTIDCRRIKLRFRDTWLAIVVRAFEGLWQPPSPGEKCNPEQDNDAGRYLSDTRPLKTEDGACVVLVGIGSRGPSLQEAHEVSEDPHVAPSSVPRVERKS